MPCRLEDLAAIMPRQFIAEAVKRWIFELGHAGKLEFAEKVFMQFQQVENFQEDKANAGVFLLARSVFGLDMLRALRLYECLRKLGDGQILTGIRLKAAHLMIHGSLPDNLEAACKIWEKFAPLPLTESQQWHWAQSGVDLIRGAMEMGDQVTARRIFNLFCSVPLAPRAQNFVEQASELLRENG